MIERIYHEFTPVCDACGEALEACETFEDAVRKARDAEWKSRKIKGVWLDYCTRCSPELNQIKEPERV
jgi:hypothetical protein